MRSKPQIRDWIAHSPKFRAAFAWITNLIAGILASWFVAEMTGSQITAWEDALSKSSTYVIFLFLLLLAIYYRYCAKYESDLLRYSDDDYCIARFRREIEEDVTQEIRRLLQKGEKPADLIEAYAVIEKFYSPKDK